MVLTVTTHLNHAMENGIYSEFADITNLIFNITKHLDIS